jgi:hypothetical protein
MIYYKEEKLEIIASDNQVFQNMKCKKNTLNKRLIVTCNINNISYNNINIGKLGYQEP